MDHGQSPARVLLVPGEVSAPPVEGLVDAGGDEGGEDADVVDPGAPCEEEGGGEDEGDCGPPPPVDAGGGPGEKEEAEYDCGDPCEAEGGHHGEGVVGEVPPVGVAGADVAYPETLRGYVPLAHLEVSGDEARQPGQSGERRGDDLRGVYVCRLWSVVCRLVYGHCTPYVTRGGSITITLDFGLS